MAAFDPLSPEVVYSLKGNVAYPLVSGSGSTIATTAGNRIKDAATESNAAQTQRISAITVANAPVVNQ